MILPDTIISQFSIPFTKLPGFPRVWQAVLNGDSSRPLPFLRPPASIEACAATARETLSFPRHWQKLAQIVRQSSLSYGVPESALGHLAALAQGKAVAVVTGQQVGYLGGPLFTFLKAYHTTRLAAELEERLGLPVIPIFWLEGRDHDLEEVRDASYLAASGDLRTLRFTPESEIPGFEVGRYRVAADEHLIELSGAIESPHQLGFDLLQRAYSNATLADAMGRFLASTLGARGLLIIEGMDPRLKALASPLWEQIISAGPRLTDLFYARVKELEAAGWDTPMTPTHDSYLFYLTREHRRAALSYSGQLKHPDGHTEQLTPEQLRALVRDNPDILSPKAALRPAYQDYILPTIAYVAGPGELSYHAQLTPFYQEFGIIPSSLFPRLSATITDHKIERQLSKAGLSAEQVLTTSAHDLAKAVVHHADETHAAELFAASREQIENIFHRLKDHVAQIDPTLAGAAQTAAGRAVHPLDQLQEKTERALKQKHAATLARLEKLSNALRPHDKLAERVLSSGYFIAKYGPEKILAALDSLPAIPIEHHVLTLD